jgi:hypothetical protein
MLMILFAADGLCTVCPLSWISWVGMNGLAIYYGNSREVVIHDRP